MFNWKLAKFKNRYYGINLLWKTTKGFFEIEKHNLVSDVSKF